MKITVSFVFLAALSVLFYGCKSDEIINNNPPITGSYEWSSTPVTFAPAYDVQVIDRNNCFVSTTTGLYKITNNVPELFTVNSSVFKAEAGYIYDDTYIVYKGRKVSDNKRQFMIYDNGAYTIYDMPDSSLSIPFFESRGKFYCAHYFFPNYYKFENGTFTSVPIAENHVAYFAKANGNMYFFAIVSSSLTRKIYRITESVPVFIREESINLNSSLQFLNNAIIKIDSPVETVSYFSESGWINMFTLPPVTKNFFTIIEGEDANAFTVIRQDTSYFFNAGRWNGSIYTQLTNIPSDINFYNTFYSVGSRFRDNTFYIMVNDGSGNRKIIKGTYRE